MGALKDFIRPEIKKLVLPAVLVISFFLMIYLFGMMGSMADQQAEAVCANVDDLEGIAEYINTDVLESLGITNASMQDIKSMIISQVGETNPEIVTALELMDNTVKSFRTIDPYLPVPCMLYQEGACRYYLSSETFNCLSEFYTLLQPSLGLPDLEEYRQISAADYAVNVSLLFLEGYVSACLMVFVFREIRRRQLHEE
jgi:hypothetical protein